jgi:hypothetical protein
MRRRGKTVTGRCDEVPASKRRVRRSHMTSLRKKGKYVGDAHRMGQMAAARQGRGGAPVGGSRCRWLLGLL